MGTTILAIDLGANGCYANVQDIPTGDYETISITKKEILEAADEYEPSVESAEALLTWGLEIIPTKANAKTWFVDNFAFVGVQGARTGITFRLHNEGGGAGDFRVRAYRYHSPTR